MQLLDGITYLGVDTETFLIGPEDLAPREVCLSSAYWNPQDPEANLDGFVVELLGNGDEGFKEAHQSLLSDPTIHFVATNAAYDFNVFCRMFPDLEPSVWQAYEDERVHCTACREKVLNLSDHGNLKREPLPDGSMRQLSYSQMAMEEKYLGIDRSKEKQGDDIWRLNFSKLDGQSAQSYPPAASSYAKEDALGALRIFFEQMRRQQAPEGPCSLATSEFQAAVAFALQRISMRGMMIDPAEFAKAKEAIADSIDPKNLQLMISSGLLRPPEPPRPYKRAATPDLIDLKGLRVAEKRALLAGCWSELDMPERIELDNKSRIVASKEAFTRLVKVVEEAPPVVQSMPSCKHLMSLVTLTEPSEPKLTKAKPASLNKKRLEQLVATLREQADLPVVYSNPQEEDPAKRNISCTEEIVEEVAHLSPVLQEYLMRQAVQKLVTTEFPRMCYPDGTLAEVVHPCFDVLKETTRTSSFAGGTFSPKEGGPDVFLYPSFNGQNVDPRVRPCFKARPGWALLSIDFESIELVSAADRQLALFGQSKLAELLLAGVDLHAYMGSVLAYNLSQEFRDSYDQQGSGYDEMRIYNFFKGCGSDPREEVRDFYKHWRKFAKPVGLGFPGGLGPATFIGFAKGYGVTDLTVELATTLREIWKRTFPEFQMGFDWINNQCQDQRRPIIGYKKNGQPVKGYAYTSPLGAHRAACKYTSAANGKFLQTPTAEGAKVAVFECVRACYDHSRPSPALGCHVVNFVHDELIFEIPLDGYEHERAYYLAGLMEEAMGRVITRLPIKAGPALMLNWHKEAEAVFDERGRLTLWYPEEKTA